MLERLRSGASVWYTLNVGLWPQVDAFHFSAVISATVQARVFRLVRFASFDSVRFDVDPSH